MTFEQLLGLARPGLAGLGPHGGGMMAADQREHVRRAAGGGGRRARVGGVGGGLFNNKVSNEWLTASEW